MNQPSDIIEQTRQECDEYIKNTEKQMMLTQVLAKKVAELEDYIDWLLRRIKKNERSS